MRFTMRSTARQMVLSLAVSAGLGVTACGSMSSAATSHDSVPKAAAHSATRTLSIGTATILVAGQRERVLTTSSGRILYYVTPDQDGKMLACSGTCLTAWPPLLLLQVTNAATANGSLPGKLDAIMRPDGTRQVTYDGWPLYRFAGDKAPGDVTGQGIGGT